MFVRSLLHDHVKLKAHELGKNFKQVLAAKLRASHEGRCTRHGYVVPSSIEFSTCTLGKLDGASLNGDVTYLVEYVATICNPPTGSVVTARVVNINRFGILAEGGALPALPGHAADEHPHSVLDIIIAKQGLSMSTEVDLDRVRIGDMLTVEILGKRFELNDAKISIVGKVLSHSSNMSNNMSNLSNMTHQEAAGGVFVQAQDSDADEVDDVDDDSDIDSDGEANNSEADTEDEDGGDDEEADDEVADDEVEDDVTDDDDDAANDDDEDQFMTDNGSGLSDGDDDDDTSSLGSQ